MGFFASFFYYSIFAAAYITVFVVIETVLDNHVGAGELYRSFEDYVILSGVGEEHASKIRLVFIAVVSLILTSMLRLRSVLSLLGCSEHEIVSVPASAPEQPPGTLDDGADAGIIELRRRILQQRGRYPPLDAFPLLDAPTLRPYHRFSDSSLYESSLFELVHPNYNAHDKELGTPEFFAEVDRLVRAMGVSPSSSNPLPLSIQRHPRLIHTHPYMAHRRTLPHVTEMVFLHHEKMQALSPVYNPLHHEQRIIIRCLIFVLGRLDQAASFGDLERCILCLMLIDNLTTSFRGLCEVEYSLREEARRTGF